MFSINFFIYYKSKLFNPFPLSSAPNTIASVNNIVLTVSIAFSVANLITFAGSMIPASNIFTNSPVKTLKPMSSLFFKFSTGSFTSSPIMYPAFSRSVKNGITSDFLTMSKPSLNATDVVFSGT